MRPIQCDYAYLFPGGVPGWTIFGMQVQDIRKLLKRTIVIDSDVEHGSDVAELCLVGLVAYFEGFVRYHFASLINICPKLLDALSKNRPSLVIPLRDIADLDDVHTHIGFLVADQCAFSSPREINGLFHDLLGLSPFSKKDIADYDAVLHNRHQIVHSAGLYTTKYLRAHRHRVTPERNRPYLDSVEITTSNALRVADFLLDMAKKIVTTSYKRLLIPTNWNSKAERKARAHHLSFLKWTPEAFAQQEDACDSK